MQGRRSVSGSSKNDFARQLAERNAELHPATTKKFRSSAAPKGTKLRSGYLDRTQLRSSEVHDDKAVRVKALEDMVRLGQMEPATFETLRDEIVGGDVKNVHLVKGLDYKLLERVRRGEDVLASAGKAEAQQRQDENRILEPKLDVDEELDKLVEKETQPTARTEGSKHGEVAPAPPVTGKKRTRDDILNELKASRIAAAEKAKQSCLGPRFVKVGEKKAKPRIEKDERGREILITVDEDGRVKRKVKKPQSTDGNTDSHGLLMPGSDAKPLGMDVTSIAPQKAPADEDDGCIFEGVGFDYNPLGSVSDDEANSNDSNDDGGKVPVEAAKPSLTLQNTELNSAMPPPPLPAPTLPSSKRLDYFGDSRNKEGIPENAPSNPLSDPTMLAALRKASAMNPLDSTLNEEEAAKLALRKKLLDSHDRDAEDMDMGFGGSRFDDEEEGEGKKVKLSVWGGDQEEGSGKGEGLGKRKRGPKRKKGNVHSAADVLNVIERRRGERR